MLAEVPGAGETLGWEAEDGGPFSNPLQSPG